MSQLFKLKSNLLIPLLAISIGFIAAFLVIIYKYLINTLFANSFLKASDVYIIFMPIIGGLITGLLLYAAKINTASSVKNISDFVTSTQHKIEPKKDFFSAVASIFTIGFGGSLGPETPSAQLGATSGILSAKIFNLETEFIKTLAACGVSAGISAAFNAPIAGFIFVIELIYKELPKYALGAIMLSSVFAAVVVEYFSGNSPAFTLPSYETWSVHELPFIILLGFVCAFTVYMFIMCLNFFKTTFELIKVNDYIKPAIGGVAIGILGYFVSTRILGIGYSSIENILSSNVTNLLFLLLFGKIIATSITHASNGQGGLIAPALFIGASVGACFNLIMQTYFNIDSLNIYAFLAMGAVLAGVSRAPIFSIVLLFEMTQNYTIILPLTLCVTIVVITNSFLKK